MLNTIPRLLLFIGGGMMAMQADVVFSNYGPGNSICTPNCGTWDSGSHQHEEPYYRGMAFNVPPGTSYRLDSLTISAFKECSLPLASSCTGSAAPIYVVAIASDSNGLPGPVLEQFTFSTLDGTDRQHPASLTGNSVLHPTLVAGGRYWITTAVANSTPFNVQWPLNGQGSSGLVSWHAGQNTPWTIIGNLTQGAFSVSGTQTITPTRNINVTTNLSRSAFTISEITGLASFRGNGTSFTVSSVPPGTYTITYDSVAGYATPANQTQSLTSSDTATFNGTYALLTGTLTISTNTPGATFMITGPASFSGVAIVPSSTYALPAGNYKLSFGSLIGFASPPNKSITINPSSNVTVDGTYTLISGTGSVMVTVNPPVTGYNMTGPIGFSGKSSALFSSAPTGTYKVQFFLPPGSTFPPLPLQTNTLITNGSLLFDSKLLPSNIPIKVVSPRVCNPITSNPFDFGGDICILFLPRPGAPQGKLQGIVQIINGTGAWYSVTINRTLTSVIVNDAQLPSVFLLPPRGPNSEIDSSNDPTLYIDFGLGDSLVLDLERDSIEAGAVFAIDFISRVFLGTPLPAFSSTGFLSLAGLGVVPEAIDALTHSNCAGAFTKLFYNSAATSEGQWQDLGEALTCVAHDPSALAAMTKLTGQFMTTDQQSKVLSIIRTADKVFTILNFASNAISATEAFGGYYAAPIRGELRLDGVTRGK